MSPLRIVHIPGRTPYARKLRGDDIYIVNGTTSGEFAVPEDVTLAWLMDRWPWDWFDVVHLHHIDFEPVPLLRAALAACRRAGKRVVFTAHDLSPVFGDRTTHHRRLRILAEHDVPFACLTSAAEADIHQRLPVRTIVAPHGYVAQPGTPQRQILRESGPTRFLMYGSLRSNRDVELVLACWRFARDLRESTMHLLLRAPSRRSLAEDAAVWEAIRAHTADPRLRVDVLPFPSDDDVNGAVAQSDCLLLPYRWASHSGQLEHAFDLGVLPVAARTGYLPYQAESHDGLVSEPEWFSWPAGEPFGHGARLLAAMQAAHGLIQNGWCAPHRERFAHHRQNEHTEILAAYRTLYGGTER